MILPKKQAAIHFYPSNGTPSRPFHGQNLPISIPATGAGKQTFSQDMPARLAGNMSRTAYHGYSIAPNEGFSGFSVTGGKANGKWPVRMIGFKKHVANTLENSGGIPSTERIKGRPCSRPDRRRDVLAVAISPQSNQETYPSCPVVFAIVFPGKKLALPSPVRGSGHHSAGASSWHSLMRAGAFAIGFAGFAPTCFKIQSSFK